MLKEVVELGYHSLLRTEPFLSTSLCSALVTQQIAQATLEYQFTMLKEVV